MKECTGIQALLSKITGLEARLAASEWLSGQRRVCILELERQLYGRRSEKRLPEVKDDG